MQPRLQRRGKTRLLRLAAHKAQIAQQRLMILHVGERVEAGGNIGVPHAQRAEIRGHERLGKRAAHKQRRTVEKRDEDHVRHEAGIADVAERAERLPAEPERLAPGREKRIGFLRVFRSVEPEAGMGHVVVRAAAPRVIRKKHDPVFRIGRQTSRQMTEPAGIHVVAEQKSHIFSPLRLGARAPRRKGEKICDFCSATTCIPAGSVICLLVWRLILKTGSCFFRITRGAAARTTTWPMPASGSTERKTRRNPIRFSRPGARRSGSAGRRSARSATSAIPASCRTWSSSRFSTVRRCLCAARFPRRS